MALCRGSESVRWTSLQLCGVGGSNSNSLQWDVQHACKHICQKCMMLCDSCSHSESYISV